MRAGVIYLKEYVLYIIPPGETAAKIYEIEGDKMIGIFVSLEDIKAKKQPPTRFLEENGIEKPVIKTFKEDLEELDFDKNELEKLINPNLLSKNEF